MAKILEINYKVAKQTTLGKRWFLHFNIAEIFVEEESRHDEANAPLPSRSTGFFDDPGSQNENLELRTGDQNEIRPIWLRSAPVHRKRFEHWGEPLPTTRPENDTLETYNAVEPDVKARRQNAGRVIWGGSENLGTSGLNRRRKWNRS